MSRTVTLSQLRSDIANLADVTVGSSTRYTSTYLNRLINQSIQRFRERVSAEGMAHFLVSTTGTLTAGATSPYSFAELDLSNVSPSVVRTYGVDITVNGVVTSLAHRPFTERNDYGTPQSTSIPRCWMHYQTRKIALSPAPMSGYSYTVWYLPVLADLSADGDTFDGVAGWEDYCTYDVALRLITRDQYATAHALFTQNVEAIWRDILRGASKVTAAGGANVGRDTFGRSPRVLSRQVPAFAGPGAPATHSVTNAMLAEMPEERLKGRARAAGYGEVTDLTPGQAAGAVAVFSGFAAGLVPTGAGNAGLFLSNAGSWLAPSVGGSVSGLALSQIQDIASPRVLGRVTVGTGAPEQLLGQQVASMIGTFTGSAHGLVPYPSGGAGGGLFLKDDATWGTPAGGSSTGLALSQFNPFPPLSVLGNPNVGSGSPDYLTRGQVASMMPLFGAGSGSTRGFVHYPTGGAAGNFLRDDGAFVGVPTSVATGLTLSQLAPANPFNVLGRFTSGTGAVEQLPPGQVASLLPNHFGGSGTTRGLVHAPTGGVLGRFLRDDGSFQGVPTNVATGVTLAQLAAIPESTILGRTSPSGIPEALTPSAVASMFPLFNNIDKGLVPGGSAGDSTKFLSGAGTWLTPAGGGGGGANNPGGPTGAFQYNLGSGMFGGASGFAFTASGISISHRINIPTGSISFGASALSTGHILVPHNSFVITGDDTTGGQSALMRWGTDGTKFLTLGNNTLVDRLVNRTAVAQEIAVGGSQAFLLEGAHQRLGNGYRLGIPQLAHSAATDKLGAWTASGFANVATGITVSASGYQLSVGSGGPVLHASGIHLRTGDMEGVRRINGLDGIKLFGFVPGGGAASGTQEIVVGSGTAFVVPETVTTGQVFALIPTGAIHGDTVLLENRTGISHMVNNAGTGMGVPSFFVATLPPSGGLSFRFASGAWEYGNRYKLGGS